jgi:glycosyltransferase involved in cell wall biosynthesis
MARRAGRRNGHRVPEAPTRVLFLHTATQPPLGADTWVHAQIMDRLDRSTHEVHAACATGPADRPTPTYALLRTIPGVRIFPVNLGSERAGSPLGALVRMLWSIGPALLSLLRLARYIRRNGISVLHTSDRPRDAFVCVLLGRLTGAKSLIHVHVGWGEWMSPPLQWALRRADGLIAISAFVAETLAASGHDPERTAVVLNGIDPQRWNPGSGREEARRELGVAGDTAIILSVCRLFPEKGPADLIRAFAAIDGDEPAHVLIVGQEMTQGFAAELDGLAAELGVARQVTLAGRRDDVPRLMAAADIYAMPSFAEPFGLVYLEAMAMELPVVALDNGGTPEVVEDGVTGLLSAPADGTQLAEHLRCLLDDPRRRRTMGQCGRERVVAKFTIERMANDVAAVYRAVMSPQRAKSETGSDGRELIVTQ